MFFGIFSLFHQRDFNSFTVTEGTCTVSELQTAVLLLCKILWRQLGFNFSLRRTSLVHNSLAPRSAIFHLSTAQGTQSRVGTTEQCGK